ncbi:unnamed protein product, partial [Mesorhabditis belari]|uniref:non-specific serine/threonine protein kinase n=1 Tax=Mesorhabditis belari TaxID=2138241 RepID=A0AAF3J7Q4_9BILA
MSLYEKVFLDGAEGASGQIYLLKNFDPLAVMKCYKSDQFAKLHMASEIESLKAVRHKHIVQYFGARDEILEDGEAISGVIMEYCERGSLDKWIFNPTAKYTVKTVLTWAEQLLRATEYLEEIKRLHNDIKTENILVTQDFNLKLGDLGLSTTIDEHSSNFFGTPRFMSPERIKDGSISFKSDIYAIGLILWEIITRRKIFMKFFHGGVFHIDELLGDEVSGKDLKAIEPLDCLQSLQSIVFGCCFFDSNSRLSASKALLLCDDSKQSIVDYDKYDFRPEILDLNLDKDDDQKLIRPIGFNGTNEEVFVNKETDAPWSSSYKNKKLWSTDEVPREEASQETDELRETLCGEALLEKLLKQRNHQHLRKLVNGHPEIRDFFIGKESVEMSEYISLASAVIKSKVDEQFIYEFSWDSIKGLCQQFSDGKPVKQNTNDDDYLAGLINEKLDEDFLIQKLFFQTLFMMIHTLREADTSIGNWSLSIGIRDIANRLEHLREKVHKRFHFKCYILTSTKDEWFFVADYPNRLIFVRRDFSEMRPFSGKWENSETYVIRNDDFAKKKAAKMLFSRLEPVDLDTVNAALQRHSEKISSYLDIQFRSFRLKHGDFTRSKRTGQELPIRGYVFDLKNPPRPICYCKPTACEVVNRIPEWVSKKHQFPIFRCTEKRISDYTNLYILFCDYLFQCESEEQIEFPNYFFNNRKELKSLLKDLSCSPYFQLCKILDSKGKEAFLLEIPKINGESVLCFNENSEVFSENVSLDQVDLSNLHAFNVSEAYENLSKVVGKKYFDRLSQSSNVFWNPNAIERVKEMEKIYAKVLDTDELKDDVILELRDHCKNFLVTTKDEKHQGIPEYFQKLSDLIIPNVDPTDPRGIFEQIGNAFAKNPKLLAKGLATYKPIDANVLETMTKGLGINNDELTKTVNEQFFGAFNQKKTDDGQNKKTFSMSSSSKVTNTGESLGNRFESSFGGNDAELSECLELFQAGMKMATLRKEPKAFQTYLTEVTTKHGMPEINATVFGVKEQKGEKPKDFDDELSNLD